MKKALVKVLKRLYKNKYTKFLVLIILYFEEVLKWVKRPFKNDVKVYVQYKYTNGKQEVDTVKCRVIKRGHGYWFDGIPFEDVGEIIKTLREENKPLDFEVSYGGGWRNDVRLTPKLRRLMAERFEELVESEEIV